MNPDGFTLAGQRKRCSILHCKMMCRFAVSSVFAFAIRATRDVVTRPIYGRSPICNLFSLKRHGRLCSHISGFSLLSRHHNEIRQENVLHPFGLKAHAANDLFLLRSYLFCHYCDYTLHFSEPPDSFPSFKIRPSDRCDFPVFTPASQH